MNQALDVLVCSYNESESLPDLLYSLQNQTVPSEKFNIIFVDNASDDNTKETIIKYQELLKNLQYVYEPNQGKSHALNTGYKIATSEYVAQTDADCKVDEKWIENIIKLIDQEHPDLFGGPYFPYYKAEKPKWYKDEYNTYTLGNQLKVLKNNEYLSGANTIYKRELVQEIGGYNTSLGITNSSLAGGEDTELIVRAKNKYPRIKIIYDPSIVVFHLTKHKCFDLYYLSQRNFITGVRRMKIFGKANKNYYSSIQANSFCVYLKFIYFALKILLNFFLGILIMFIKKEKYKYYENYYYEIILSDFYRLGYTSFLFRKKPKVNN